jgi:O-antigen ligase
MRFDLLQKRFGLIAIWSWGFMALCLPFSTALTLIFSTFGVLFGLLGFNWPAFTRVMRSPIAILCVALFAWLALSMLWSIAPRGELIEGISKYRKLLYVPLVAMLLVSTRVKPWFLMNFFVVGCLVVCLGSLSSSTGLVERLIGPQSPGGGWSLGGAPSKHWFYIGPPEMPTFGRAWISQSAFLVFSATYLIGVLLQTYGYQRKSVRDVRIVALALATMLMVLVVLNLGSRTGYVLLFVGLLLWVLKLAQWKRWKFSIGLLLVSITIVIGFVGLNQRVVERTQTAITDVTQYRESGALTSQGLRLRFWEAGLRAGIERPVIGWGVGSYPEVFAMDERQPRELKESRPHPHSEYVLQFVQGGGVAFLLFTAMGLPFAANVFGMKFQRVDSAHQAAGVLSIAAILLLIDGGFNSVIWDLAEGHNLAFLLASIAACSLTTTSARQEYVPRRSSVVPLVK